MLALSETKSSHVQATIAVGLAECKKRKVTTRILTINVGHRADRHVGHLRLSMRSVGVLPIGMDCRIRKAVQM